MDTERSSRVNLRQIGILVLLLVITKEQIIAEECNNGAGVCSAVSDCAPILNNFIMIYAQIQYCDPENSVVCCPKPKEPDAHYLEDLDKSKRSVKECVAARKQVYEKCDSEPLIVGGTKANPKEFPHMALLGNQRADNTYYWVCAGTLISTTYVVSAAHCFAVTVIPDSVRLGELDYNSTSDDAQPQDFRIKNYITHPVNDAIKKYNDIVLIELDHAAVFNSYVVPACLPLTNGTEFKEFTATGWGNTKFAGANSTHLRKVKLEQFDEKECKSLIDASPTLDVGVLERTQLCAGSHTGSNDTCQGDSGGPLFVEHPDYPCMFLLVGITSFGESCGTAGVPGVYVRVNLYVEWIENIVWNTTIGW